MTRKEVLAKIKEMDLNQEVIDRFGRNCTQVSSEALEDLIIEYENDDSYKEDETCNEELPEEFVKLVDILHKKRILLDSEYDEIIGY